MKTLFLFFALTLSTIGFGQITLEKMYSNVTVNLVNITNGGYEYYYFDTLNHLYVYSFSHSLLKTIAIPKQAGFDWYKVLHISDELFNKDASIEYIVWYHNYHTGADRVDLVEESGTVLNTFINTAVDNKTWNGDFSIFSNNGAYKLEVLSGKGSDIYALPGSIPCSECSGIVGISNVHNQQNNGYPFPNPADGFTEIPYSLPSNSSNAEIILYSSEGKEVQRYNVEPANTSLKISTSEFSPGLYYYQINTAQGNIGAKKLVIVK